MTTLYAEITKSEKQDDGTIKVWGFASTEAVDSDGEVITADAMKAAKDGYMAFANVREMHDPKKAAGVAIDYEVQDDGKTFFGALVVDPIAVKKVESGVYKGFSIGGKVPKGGRDGKVIKQIELVEVSLVDRPANPEAVFTVFKADGAASDEVAKGLYAVGDFAAMLQSLAWVAAECQSEADWEGDSSPIPAQIKSWVVQGLGIMQAMAKEEADELAAMLGAAAEKTGKGGDVTKAGKKFSAATKAALKAAHDACKAADKALADLGYDGDEESGDEGGEGADKAAKSGAEDVIIKAAQAERDAALAKAEAAEEKAAELQAKIDAMPVPIKGAVNAFAKGQDVTIGDEAVASVATHNADGTLNQALTLIKAAHARMI